MLTQLLIFGAGAVLGAALAAIWLLMKRASLQSQLAATSARATLVDQQNQQQMQELAQLREELHTTHAAHQVAQSQLQSVQQQFEQHRKTIEEAERKLADTFARVGNQALDANSQRFLAIAREVFESHLKQAAGDVDKKQQAIDHLVKPIKELLDKQGVAIKELETKRESAYARLDEQIRHIALSHDKLASETNRLVTALSKSHAKGQWGELQLRNIVELAGMTEHCDFSLQVTVWRGEEKGRPDMVVRMPGRGKAGTCGGIIPIDAKVSLDAYLAAMEPDADRAALFRKHAQAVQSRVDELAQKKYWDAFEHAPQVVVMFVPLESALTAALEINPDLHAHAMQQHVLIATPTLLVALLRAVAYGWQQEAVQQNAREIAEAGKALYERLATFVSHLESVGKSLDSSSKAYNKAIGSLERSVLSGARRLKELHATVEADIEAPAILETEIRAVQAAELKPPSPQFSPQAPLPPLPAHDSQPVPHAME